MAELKIADLGKIQGDILLNGFPKKAEIFCFFTIRAAQQFCQNIQTVANSKKIATGEDIKNLRERISKLPAGKKIDEAKVNIAFTSGGLRKVDIQLPMSASRKLTDTVEQCSVDTSGRPCRVAKFCVSLHEWYAE